MEMVVVVVVVVVAWLLLAMVGEVVEVEEMFLELVSVMQVWVDNTLVVGGRTKDGGGIGGLAFTAAMMLEATA